MDLNTIYRKTIDDALKQDMRAIDCLLHPEKHPPIWKFDKCTDCGECKAVCTFNALERDENGDVKINFSDCVYCGDCISACPSNKIIESREIYSVLSAISEGKKVYALVAPAFFAQSQASVGQMRTAFKKLGFAGMLEVAMFADILTLKESLHLLDMPEGNFMLASCCCPIWIALIRKTFNGFIPHIPPSVSPMIAGGRILKKEYGECVTVFISPCLAKKAEAREEDLVGAIDYVITFDEINSLFQSLHIDPEQQEEDDKENTSSMGRLYAKSGGVSHAVTETAKAFNPDRKITYMHAESVPSCRELLSKLQTGEINFDYIEGMGCSGGCIGGPKTVAKKEYSQKRVSEIAENAVYPTPKENPFVFKLLDVLGIDTLEKLCSCELLSRKF